jgi:hypothetical protein
MYYSRSLKALRVTPHDHKNSAKASKSSFWAHHTFSIVKPHSKNNTMRTTYLLPTLFSPATGIPAPCTEGNPGSVYVCSDVDFKGQCHYLQMIDYCYGFVEYSPLSIGPDPGGYCTTYADIHCSESQTVHFILDKQKDVLWVFWVT